MKRILYLSSALLVGAVPAALAGDLLGGASASVGASAGSGGASSSVGASVGGASASVGASVGTGSTTASAGVGVGVGGTSASVSASIGTPGVSRDPDGTTGTRGMTPVSDLARVARKKLIGQPVIASDDVVLGRIVELRQGGKACPTFGVEPSRSLSSGYRKVWVQSNSCALGEDGVQISMSSNTFIEQTRN